VTTIYLELMKHDFRLYTHAQRRSGIGYTLALFAVAA